MVSDGYIVSFDYGEKRVGVAVAHTIARIPRPLMVVANGEKLYEELAQIIAEEHAIKLVVGLPRNMDGSVGSQAERCKAFGATLAEKTGLEVSYADETLSSVDAEKYLEGLKGASIGLDAVAAAVILERYFEEGGENDA